MDAELIDAAVQALVADIEVLRQQAARPPNAAYTDECSDALGRIYSRFVRRVHAFCRKRVLFSLPADCAIEEFVETVFFRFVRSADKLVLRNVATMNVVERQLLVCFHGHALWAIRDLLRKPEKVQALEGAILRDLGIPRSDDDSPPLPHLVGNRLRLRDELNRAGDRAFDVLSTSYQYQNLETGEFNLPVEVRDALCARCNFSSPNALVQYRKRLIEKLHSRLTSVA